MLGTDLTATLTGEGQAAIFITVDHASTECLGIHAARRARRSATTTEVVAGRARRAGSRRSSPFVRACAPASALSPRVSPVA